MRTIVSYLTQEGERVALKYDETRLKNSELNEKTTLFIDSRIVDEYYGAEYQSNWNPFMYYFVIKMKDEPRDTDSAVNAFQDFIEALDITEENNGELKYNSDNLEKVIDEYEMIKR